ncbi:MAG: hypothetical protein ACI8RD_011128, partial [Bacillariaceae sp.]
YLFLFNVNAFSIRFDQIPIPPKGFALFCFQLKLIILAQSIKQRNDRRSHY